MQTLQLPDKHGEQEGAIQVAGYGAGEYLISIQIPWILSVLSRWECFFEVAEVSGLNSTTKMGGMDGFLSQRFQGHQISVRNRMRFPLNQGIQGKKGKQNNFQKH